LLISNVIKEEGDLVTDYHSVLARWRSHFSQLLNVNGVNAGSQTEIHTAWPLVHELSAFEVEMAIEKKEKTNHQVLIKSQQN
jgi:hypothetical protein